MNLPHGNKPAPAYLRVEEAIVRRIRDNVYASGDKLPSERQLAEQFNVSVGTVKKALGNLGNAGFCYSLQGKGTFVTRSKIKKEHVKYYNMSDEFLADRAQLSVSLLGVDLCPPPEAAAQIFSGENLLCRISRLYLTGDAPLLLTRSFISRAVCPEAAELSKEELEQNALYRLLEERFFVRTVHSEEMIHAVAADAETAGFLDCAPGTPVLFIRMAGYTADMRIFEYRESYVLTNKFGLTRVHGFQRA